jgi:hypothetical protein
MTLRTETLLYVVGLGVGGVLFGMTFWLPTAPSWLALVGGLLIGFSGTSLLLTVTMRDPS